MADDDRAMPVLPFDPVTGEYGRPVRIQWHEGRRFFSVVDVIGLLTASPDPRTYWAVLKKRLQAEGASEPLTKCKQLKMRARDGKMRETDAADTETVLRIIESVPSPIAEPVKQWLARVGAARIQEVTEADELAGLTEAQRRILARHQLADQNRELAAAAQGAGVLSSRDFAIFQDHGYRGLYAGEGAKDIAARKELPKGAAILDWMGSEELAANLFRSTQAEAKLRRDPTIATKEQANQTHHDMGTAVRQFILDQGGTPPEQLPTPEQSMRQLERSEAKRLEAERQPSLFDEPESDD